MWYASMVFWTYQGRQGKKRKRIGAYTFAATVVVPMILLICTLIVGLVYPSSGEPGVGDAFFGLLFTVLSLMVLIPVALITNALIFIYSIKNKTEANQALLPTPMSVTPAADAPVAPDTGAARL